MSNHSVQKKVLANGLTVLVRPIHNIPKVSIQLWYNVGSKDEKSNEKGIAHLLEHMIFKGTNRLSESDINLITSKLSGYCNAFTSYDYTGYMFDFPSQHWQAALPMLADCMSNCTFKEDLLNSELKAVIQELKMYRDDYGSALVEKMLNAMFPGHPYQHPIIGYKQDLWNLTRENLVNFYKHHYIPNNATLVVVGDVQPDEVFALAEREFGPIKPNREYTKEEFYLEKDLAASQAIIYRDVQQPLVSVGFLIPGAVHQMDYAVDVLSLILADGRDSRLHKRLVEQEHLVTEVGSFSYDLFDHQVFFIQFEPTEHSNILRITEIIQEEIEKLRAHSYSEKELLRATKKVQARYLSLLENNQQQAYAIGKFYLATQDENFIYKYIEADQAKVKMQIQELLESYLRSSFMHTGKILPIEPENVALWQKIQAESDSIDERILSRKSRESEVEAGVHVHTLDIKPYPKFDFPKYDTLKLANGLEVLLYENKNLPKIDIILELRAKHYYDPEHLLGIGNFVSEMILEGTSKHNAQELSHEIESLGMSIKSSAGYISLSMLSEDLERGLQLLTEILTDSIFNEKSIEKVRTNLISQIKNYWDEPADFADQLIRERLYKGHPYQKNILGTIETIQKITKKDLLDFYAKQLTPHGGRMAIVGDFKNQPIEALLKRTIGTWEADEIEVLTFPELTPTIEEFDYKINRDQVVLAFAGNSINRYHADFDKILIFDQIFGGGVLGSMSSRLFQIREKSGLFYTISGSFLARADEQPGMFIVKTIVSLDRLKEAEVLIEKEIKNAFVDITDEELEQAKNALINSRVDNFSSNRQIASTFLFLSKYNLPKDFFDKRAQEILAINKADVQQAVKKIIDTPLLKIRIGRI